MSRQLILDAIPHFEHFLPGQAPIKDFVHHNTLHGYQHLNFPDALKASQERTGARGYELDERYRDYFKSGRINLSDLNSSLEQCNSDKESQLNIDEPIFQIGSNSGSKEFTRRDIYLQALINPLPAITACQLSWEIEEKNCLDNFQEDISPEARENILKSSTLHGKEAEKDVVKDLWSAILEQLELHHLAIHPESLLDLSAEEASRFSNSISNELGQHSQVRQESTQLFNKLVERVGKDLTLRGLIDKISGRDILNNIRPLLIHQIANYLDEGMSAWHSNQQQDGFYQVWRQSATLDSSWIFDDLPEWQDELEILPDDALDTIIVELKRIGIDESRWVKYLEEIALEIPGWSGMFLWRHLNPGYKNLTPTRVEMVDYLAVHLVMERLFAQRVCREEWQLEANLDVLRWYFHRRSSEFYVRYHLFNGKLPEYLVTHAKPLTDGGLLSPEDYPKWKEQADIIWTWKQSDNSDQDSGFSIYRSGWKLFRLFQHLGLNGSNVRTITSEQLRSVCITIANLSEEQRGLIWLQAYERNYREHFFNAVANNHQRGLWADRGVSTEESTSTIPVAQLVFCMDDREEGFRRHLEEINPKIETLGGAAHFGVPHFWQGVDDKEATALTPVVLVPSHEIRENEQPQCSLAQENHLKRVSLKERVLTWFNQGTRRNFILATVQITIGAPAALALLGCKIVSPLRSGNNLKKLNSWLSGENGIVTSIEITAEKSTNPTPENRQLGFTTEEQADRVESFLQNLGLVSNFSPLVVIVGHGSISQNNPHLAAYDCGACSGRHSGPNARLFAAMANRSAVRAELVNRGITIPESCWFLGSEHNTCDESIIWYDLDKLPTGLKSNLQQLQQDLRDTQSRHAQERCRRLASAPKKPTLKQALNHIQGRAVDFSQARPELGHATNAAAVIGRRSLSHGTFFDRRVFLISYDYQTDPDGKILERLLLANGPVGAGISLEYYFSTVDNENYGSGSKVTHNVSGLFGVMDGTNSDLRTGLPKQMIEIHEAMRLQVMVEAKIDMLTEIYMRQPPLQELVGNGWLLLSAKDPESEQIHIFDPTSGWVEWNGERTPLPVVKQSVEWFSGKYEPLTSCRIENSSEAKL
jgi:uncharacterized protein YbcC (UPF0753/DUF2309 family)